MSDKKRKCGMYGETPRLIIDKYSICRQDPDGDNDSVWIESEDGEGGEFKDKLFSKCIDEFYNKYL